jgi:pimeloyl-ACP methyl ester carboxylesterase
VVTARERRVGAPRARIVLVHGTRVSHVQWEVHRRWLEPTYEVALPDLPGHGSLAEVPFTMTAAVAAVAAAVEGGQGRLPVVLVGHSLGGYVAMEYAAQHPTRLAGLVLIGSTAVPSGPGAAAYRLLGKVTDRAGRDRVTRVNDRVLSRMVPPAVFAAIAADGYWFDGVSDAWSAVMTGGRPELLTGVRCPILIVRGQYDQLGVHAHRYAAAASDARVRTVRGASHLLPLTRPEQTCGIIATFAAEVTR